MTCPDLIIAGYSEACMMLRQAKIPDLRGVIAIHGQREYPVECDALAYRLVLEFDDTEAPSETDLMQAARIAIRRRQAAEIGLRLTPPTLEHASAIVAFARSVANLDGAILCHCHAGISRSPAAAILCLAAWTAPGEESACVERVLALRPSAMPHRDLVAFGDAVLSRGGRLLDALDRLRPW